MSTFKAPVDDILFSLRHVANASQSAEWDDATAADILGHFSELAENVIAPINAVGDKEGAQLVNGKVRMPTGFGTAYKQLIEDGWQGLSAPEQYGGVGVSPLIAAGVSEIFSGANHALQMVCNLVPGAINTLRLFATPAQQAEWIPRLAAGECLSTMCLTEPSAGSDLSAITCQAVQTDESWLITGEKIFISGGDQDLSQSIMHLVLARSSGAGIKGLSLFLCPSQAAAQVTRIEEKLGLHASPTCQMRFDSANAELVGEEGAGLMAMFKLMNHARIDVALQGVAHASHAAQLAQTYADDRKQGRRADGQAAVLSDHADVRRMLDEQQTLAMGARAMCHIALLEAQSGERPALVEFLTSLCKLVGSEAGIRAADLGIQILGGYGYLTEYGMDQIWRDARITAIYEGASGIHERALVTRGLRSGIAAEEFLNLVDQLATDNAAIKERAGHWFKVAKKLSATDDPTPQAHAFCNLTRQLLHEAIWARIATVAKHHPQSDKIQRLSATVLTPITL